MWSVFASDRAQAGLWLERYAARILLFFGPGEVLDWTPADQCWVYDTSSDLR